MNDFGASHDFGKQKRKPQTTEKKTISFRPHGNTLNYIEAMRELLNKDKMEGGLYENWDNTSILLNQIIKKAYVSRLQEDAMKKATSAIKEKV